MIPLIQAPSLMALPWLKHGFTTRAGGVSFGQQALNLSFAGDDSPDHVRENRRRAAAAVGAERLVAVRQIHGTQVLEAGDWPDTSPPEADGIWTQETGVCLGVMVADCGPVLLVDTKARRIGAAHAGWKGAVGGVLDTLVGSLTQQGSDPQDMIAVLGPTIAWDSYEVGPSFADPILAQDQGHARFFRPSPSRPAHQLFNLPGYIEARLTGLGVGRVEVLDEDTLSQPDKLFSYRYAQQNGQPDYGRMMGLLCLHA